MPLFKQVVDALDQQKPFVIYSKSNQQTVVGMFQKTAALFKLDDYKSKGFVFAPFDGQQAVFIPYSESEVIVEPWIPNEEVAKEVTLNYDDKRASSAFEALVKKGVAAIKSARFDKVVLSRKETLVRESISVIDWYKKLKSTYPTAFCYLFFHPEVGMWMGATPEQLLKVGDNRVFTMALAGTQLDKQQNPVVWGEKEQQEQRFVTDFILDSLSEYVTELSITAPFTAYAGTIMHIRTDIEGNLNNIDDLKNIIDKLHPTPAVCGMPKQASRDFILAEEGYDRKFYSGYLGELNGDLTLNKDGFTDLFVNLRCMELEEHQIHLYLGCGITRDSVASDEFIETVNKSSTMKKIVS
ncbi:isochorismate synthase [Flavobacterium sp. HSC-61S13]|uniref:isochorismate synthase n=1 Tax=Flavobacterium sp. HSC-61S13 TaxID=2910963 RepID=UPI0020A0AE07|nr:isochorismate synthase [Flavobacterium sp. HSC-61S13]MCP1997083.1 isochorismate synthase [Flavobacterium sp. HSC-61S13]